jgi:large subunit ribosomal protein L5
MADERVKPRLKERYQTEIVPAMRQEFDYSSVMAVPRVEKVVLNIGIGEAIQNAKALEAAARDLSTISGQKPFVRKAKKSIAAFKLRQGMDIGLTVTLRGDRMYDFLDRLLNLALPRVRDFRGVPTRSFDGRGNYTLGLREQLIFPEIEYDKVDKVRGLEVSFVTSARTDSEGRRLLELLGVPFQRAEGGARAAS